MDAKKTYTYISQILRDGSISLAAERLAISQPALSMYVRKVETELGAQLLDRSTVPISLTEAGKCCMEAFERITDVNTQLEKKLCDLNDSKSRLLRVGISPSRAPFLLPAILQTFTRVNTARVTVVEADTAELGELLMTGGLDLVIGVEAEGYAEAFEKRLLFQEEMLLAVPNAYKEEPFEEVMSHAAVISSGKGQPMDRLLGALPCGTPVREPLVECRNMLTAIALTASGIGVTPVPSYMRDYGAENGGVTFLPIPSQNGSDTRDVCVFYRKRQYLSSAEKAFIDAALHTVGGRPAEQIQPKEKEN